ncbi:flavin-containing monooxygenase [Zhongshania aliphaticivorans]|uniref:flavin-containing monooxygenase n=1 Tax=Zhongshania aliphaticivorans TaxID=1470434 RepID=UPI0012E4D3C1|nr:NAD(P)/FAD-dependent oxidoreductase [Zhongshania aliphaticivorans]CAA0106856.1 Baeyer-Villiger monooxygenase [Zhongshania aliphaticivorans]
MSSSVKPSAAGQHDEAHFDVLVVGAGFGGLRMLHEARELGLSVKVLESGGDVGGTWYWNRYPGARTDTESWGYCFFFSKVLNDEWNWPERMPGWEQVYQYMRFVVDRLDMRKDIQFETRVTAAHYDERKKRWQITTAAGEHFTCKYFCSAVGWFEVPSKPEFKGIDNFRGEWYLPSRWPNEAVDFAGKRVGIVGCGSTGAQILTAVAHLAEHVSVFQRTPNYVLPGRNYPVDEFENSSKKANFEAMIEQIRNQVYAFPMQDSTLMFNDLTPAEQQQVLEAGWEAGGFRYIFQTFADILVTKEANEAACEFARNKIRSIVNDPATAELMCPNYPIALKRPPVCNFYYESFNRPNVELVDVKTTPISEVTADGLRVGEQEYQFDILIFAMGYDAVTGPLMAMDIRGRNGQRIQDKWAAGPRTNFGIGMDGFPNMFMITGPQTPFANVPPVVEASTTWIGQAIRYMQAEGYDEIEADAEAVDAYCGQMKELVDATLIRDAASQGAWFMGANIPGKPVAVLFHFGGAPSYFNALAENADTGFAGFKFFSMAQSNQVATA